MRLLDRAARQLGAERPAVLVLARPARPGRRPRAARRRRPARARPPRRAPASGPRRAARSPACPPGATTAAAPAVAKSPCVRACSAKPLPAPAGLLRHLDLHQQLVRLARPCTAGRGRARRRPAARAPRGRAQVEARRRERSAPPAARRLGSACATEPPTVPRLRIWGWPDEPRSPCCSSGQRRRHELGALERDLAGHRPDPQRAVVGADVVELGDPVDVDHELGPREAEVEQRNEALAAGEHGAVGPEQRQRLVDRRRRARTRRARASRARLRSARHSLSSVNGGSTRTPPSASATAFATAAGVPIDAALADPLRAQRVERRRRLDERRRDRRHLRRGQQAVAGERGEGRVALLVVGRLLDEALRRAPARCRRSPVPRPAAG